MNVSLGRLKQTTTSSSKEIAPVIEVDGKTIGSGEVGPMWEKAIKAYHNYKFEA